MGIRKLVFSLLVPGVAGVYAADAGLDASIARNRMGTLTIRTVPGARVAVEQVRHGFWFGATLPGGVFSGRNSPEDIAKWKEIFTSHFNAGVPEAIMLDGSGYVAECTGDNIFMVKEGQLKTPLQGRLRGITRDAVMELAAQKLKLDVQETLITRHEFFNAEEVFLTGTAAELIPVVKIDGRRIGTGKPGPVTLKLLKLFHELARKDGVKF